MQEVPLDAVPDITKQPGTGDHAGAQPRYRRYRTVCHNPVEFTLSNLPGVLEIQSISFLIFGGDHCFEDEMGTHLPCQLVGKSLPKSGNRCRMDSVNWK